MALSEQIAALAAAFAAVHGRPATESELLVLAAHGMAESGLGTAGYREWPEGQEKPNERPEKGGPLLRTGTNNWGAVQWTGERPGVSGFFYGLDTHADGRPYRGKFNVYATAADGARDFVAVATNTTARRAKVLPILAQRDPVLYAVAQRSTGYFELAADKAGAAFLANAKQIAKKMGWAPPAEPVRALQTGAGLLPVLAIAGFAAWFFLSAS
jgi:hypothetical protein